PVPVAADRRLPMIEELPRRAGMARRHVEEALLVQHDRVEVRGPLAREAQTGQRAERLAAGAGRYAQLALEREVGVERHVAQQLAGLQGVVRRRRAGRGRNVGSDERTVRLIAALATGPAGEALLVVGEAPAREALAGALCDLRVQLQRLGHGIRGA